MSEHDPTVRVTISLPQSALEKLDRLAATNQRSRSNTILRWISGSKEASGDQP